MNGEGVRETYLSSNVSVILIKLLKSDENVLIVMTPQDRNCIS